MDDVCSAAPNPELVMRKVRAKPLETFGICSMRPYLLSS